VFQSTRVWSMSAASVGDKRPHLCLLRKLTIESSSSLEKFECLPLCSLTCKD
jgi:hypothetical protein